MIFYSVYLCYFLGVNDEVVFWGACMVLVFMVDWPIVPKSRNSTTHLTLIHMIIKDNTIFNVSLLFFQCE